MANEIKLEAYTFRIRRVNSLKQENNYLTLEDLDGEDFFEVFNNYLEFLDLLDIHQNIKKAIRLEGESLRVAGNRRLIRGIFESGGFGVESDIITLANNQHKATKNADDVEIMPFYFLVHVPERLNVGVLIIQRIGIYGISTVLHTSLHKFLRQMRYTIEFSPLISRELAHDFLDHGNVKEIIIRRYALPEDRADVLTMREYTEDIMSIELRIKAKNFFDGFTGRINRYLADPNAKFFDIPELSDLGFDEGAQYSVVAEHDGSTRTLNLSDIMKIRPYYNIDPDVNRNANGHPEFESVDGLAIELLNSLIPVIG